MNVMTSTAFRLTQLYPMNNEYILHWLKTNKIKHLGNKQRH